MTNDSGTALVGAKAEPITLMLTGGGVRFPAFVGALRAIEEKGLRINKIIGASTGSIIAALYGAGLSPGDLRKETLAVDPSRFRDASLWNLVRGYGLCRGLALESWLDAKLEGRDFSAGFRWPLQVIATDMLHYRPVVFSAESFPDLKVATAVRASAGVPGVFAYRQLKSNGKEYALVDGSLMAGVVERTLGREEKTLILKVVSKRTLNRPGGGTLTLRKYFTEMLSFLLHSQEKEFIKGGKWKDTILLYCADIAPTQFTLSQHEKNYLLEQGYEQTMKYLEYKWGI
jgi:NTE family protein